MTQLKYRLGFDLGYTSLGWACVQLDENDQPIDIIDFGVRIFPSGRDAKSHTPISVERREKRGARRNRDRYLKRRERLLKLMIKLGLQPQNREERSKLATIEPLELRAKAISQQLSLYEIGRALFHINQHRGFKSNRIADRSETAKKEQGLLKGISTLQQKLNDEGLTLGQYLHTRLVNNETTRLKADENNEDRYPSRQMYIDEFNAITTKQQQYYPEVLSSENIKMLYDTIFFQRNLKPQEVGYCTLINTEKRARLAYPAIQKFRIYQELANLAIEKQSLDTPELTVEHKKKIAHYLLSDFSKLNNKSELTFNKIQNIIGITNVTFNLEKQGRKGLKADLTTKLMQEALPHSWSQLSEDQQNQLIDIQLTSQSTKELSDALLKFNQQFELTSPITKDQIDALEKLTLDDGYGNVSLKAVQQLLPYLEKGQIYSTACQSAGFHHSDFRDGEIFDANKTTADYDAGLPYYGQVMPKQVIGGTGKESDKTSPERFYGKINNPTVHIGLNQFKRVLNELVLRYGCPPESIHIEVARETTLSAKQRSELEREQSKNRKDNERINDILEKNYQAKNYQNRMKYKLWEDLNSDLLSRACPFTGKTISLDDLFSERVEIEHLIPFSRSFDDGRNNKVVCFKSANQQKGNRTPYEAFGHNEDQYAAILSRARAMTTKFWRFLPDAEEKYRDSNSNENAWLARMLNDTKYMTRVALRYAEKATANGNKVQAIKGKITSLMRKQWQLEQFINDDDNNKDRSNHHHHAIDALTVALTGVNTMQKILKANKTAQHSHRLLEKMDPPYAAFPTEGIRTIKQRLATLVISHKLDHKNTELAIQQGGSIGQLHEESNYGLIAKDGADNRIYAIRKPLTSDNFNNRKNHIEKIASHKIREAVLAIFERYQDKEGKKIASSNMKEYEQKLNEFKQENNIKKVRIHEIKSAKEDKMIPIHDRDGNPYRFVIGGNNFCAEIWCSDKGKKAGKWQSEIIQNYSVNQKGFAPQWREDNPTAYKVMRLQINDMVAVDRDGERVICLVQKMDTNGNIILREHNDAEKDSKTQISYVASSLQRDNARKLKVSPAGKILDPGRAKQPKWNKKTKVS